MTAFFVLLMACQGKADKAGEPEPDPCDLDEDGFQSIECDGRDCDDGDPSIHPDAAEIWYDGVDQDCDGASDFDQDGDGHASVDLGGEDCDDTDYYAGPGAIEVCNDARDNDCDGAADEDPCARTLDDALGFSMSGSLFFVGADLATDCDLDGDGVLEVLTAAPRAIEDRALYGTVRGVQTASIGDEFFPKDGVVVSSLTENFLERFGVGVDCRGDLDGDGFTDLTVAAGTPVDGLGSVAVFLGPVSGEIDAADADFWYSGVIDGTEADGRVGAAVRLVDLTGDGSVDLLMGVGHAPIPVEAYFTFVLDGALLLKGPLEPGINNDWRSLLHLPGGKIEQLEVADLDGDGIDDVILTDYQEVGSSVRCARAFSGAELATSTPGTEVPAEDALWNLDCDVDVRVDPRVHLAYHLAPVHFARAEDMDDDGYSDVLVGHKNGWSAFQGAHTYTSDPSTADARLYSPFCLSYSGVVDTAFERTQDGRLVWATALGGPPDCPELDNVFLGKVALFQDWQWADLGWEDAIGWVMWDPDRIELTEDSEWQSAKPINLAFSHEVQGQTRLWIGHPSWAADSPADGVGWLAVYDLNDLIPQP